MRLRHGRKELHAHRIDAPLAAPLDLEAAVVDSLADRLDPLRLQEEVVVHEVDGAVAVLLQLLELGEDVLGTARAPLALVEDRDVAEDAGPRAAARGLHGREALARQDDRHVERHGLDEVERQTLAVRERPLVEVAVEHPRRVLAHRARRVLPRHAHHAGRIVEPLDEIEDQLLTVAAADEVHFGHLALDVLGVQRREHAAEGELDIGSGHAQLAREDLGVRIARRREKAHPDEIRLPPEHFRHDDVVRRLGIGLVEEEDLVPRALQDRGERHDADRRKPHDLKPAVLAADVSGNRVELRIADVDEHDPSGPGTHGR